MRGRRATGRAVWRLAYHWTFCCESDARTCAETLARSRTTWPCSGWAPLEHVRAARARGMNLKSGLWLDQKEA